METKWGGREEDKIKTGHSRLVAIDRQLDVCIDVSGGAKYPV